MHGLGIFMFNITKKNHIDKFTVSNLNLSNYTTRNFIYKAEEELYLKTRHCNYYKILKIMIFAFYNNLPINTAVSAILFEKPHSLSYQDKILVIPDDNTLVCCAAKVDDCEE